MKSLLLFALVSLLPAPPAAGQEVFVTRGAGSPEYSDKPQPGARPVHLPELNRAQPVTVPAVPVATAVGESRGAPEALPIYRRFSILAPEDDGSIVADTAVFEVRVAVEPELQLGEGHAIAIRIDGRPVGQRFTANEFMIPSEFWGADLPPANQRHRLDAAIVDRDGVILRQANPVTFQLRQARWSCPRPWPRPLPPVTPKPRGPDRDRVGGSSGLQAPPVER